LPFTHDPKIHSRRNQLVEPRWEVLADDELNHVQAAAQFLQDEFGSDPLYPGCTPALLRWKLGQLNSAGRGYCTLAMHEGKVIGSVTLTPRLLEVSGKLIRGAEIGDICTTAAFRRQGAAMRMHRSSTDPKAHVNRSVFTRLATETRERAEADGIQLIFGTPNRNALPGWTKRLGYRTPDALSPERRSRLLPRGVASRVPRLAPALPFLNMLDRLFARSVSALGRLRLIAYHFQGEEVEDLWQRVRHRYPFTLVRDARWIRYRYLEHPIARYQLHAVRNQEGLAALLITRAVHSPSGGKYLLLVDWLADAELAAAPARLGAAAVVSQADRTVLDGITGWFRADARDKAGLLLAGYLARGRQPVILAGQDALVQWISDLPCQEFPLGFSDNG